MQVVWSVLHLLWARLRRSLVTIILALLGMVFAVSNVACASSLAARYPHAGLFHVCARPAEIEPGWRRGSDPCYVTGMSTEELLAQVLRLPRQDRARLAEELLASLEEADDAEVAAAWAPELERRSREVADGKVQTVTWDTARTGILAELKERRARRPAS
jgi:putative addiction module component (TIGR02574 family)